MLICIRRPNEVEKLHEVVVVMAGACSRCYQRRVHQLAVGAAAGGEVYFRLFPSRFVVTL